METMSPNFPAHPVMSWPRESDCCLTRLLLIWISYPSVTQLSPPKLSRQQESTVSSSNSQQDELKDVLQQQPHSTPAPACLNTFSQARWHGLQKAQPIPEIIQHVCHICYTPTSDLPRLISFMLRAGRCLCETWNEARALQTPNESMCEQTAGSQVITTKKEKKNPPLQNTQPKRHLPIYFKKNFVAVFIFNKYVQLKNKQRLFYSRIPIAFEGSHLDTKFQSCASI